MPLIVLPIELANPSNSVPVLLTVPIVEVIPPKIPAAAAIFILFKYHLTQTQFLLVSQFSRLLYQ